MFHFSLERINSRLEKLMPLLTPTGVIIGFIAGTRLSSLAPLVTLFFALITFSGALGMNARDFIGVVKRPLPLIVFFLASHVIMPLFVKGVSVLAFPGEPLFTAGLVLLFSIPTAVSGFIWTSIHKGSLALSLTLILLDTILAPITVPLTVSLLAGTNIAIDTRGMCLSLVLMVVIPSILGIAINQASRGAIPRKVTPASKPVSKILLLAVIAINASRASGGITSAEPIFLLLALMCVFFSFAGFYEGYLAGKMLRLGKPETVSVMYGVGLRNISAALVLALDFFPARAALPVLTGIVFQQTLASFAGVVLVQKKASADPRGVSKEPVTIKEGE